MKLVIDLPPREQQIDFNRRRWEELLRDESLAGLNFRFETNAFGHITMNPPASGGHSNRQGKITVLLDRLAGGNSLPECPISTIDGVKVADVGWYSNERYLDVKGQAVFESAPEICVEVLSPSNSDSEMKVKRQLYFEAGAAEVWLCDTDGKMTFYLTHEPNVATSHSTLIPEFPTKIED